MPFLAAAEAEGRNPSKAEQGRHGGRSFLVLGAC